MKLSDRASLLVLLLASGGAACAASPSDLAQDDTSTAASTSTNTGAGGSGAGGASGAGGSGAGGALPVEPDGPMGVTFVNGLADAERAAVCLLASPYDALDPAAPLPADGLEPAASFALPSEAIVPRELELVLLAGPKSAIEGLSCRAVVDDPSLAPGVSVTSMGVLPESVFEAQRSWLFAVSGCAMRDHAEPETLGACGPGYAPDAPDPALVLAPMSRLADDGAVSLQTIHASAATVVYDLFVRTSFDGSNPIGIAQGVVLGQAAPFPPSTTFTASDFAAIDEVSLSAAIPGQGSTSLGETRLVVALGRGGLSETVVANGVNLVAVAVGSPPTLPPSEAFHPFTFVAVAPNR
jgi:hypothetical protein